MKDVIYLAVSRRGVMRMTKNLPSLMRGEIPVKLEVKPDVIADFRNMPFANKQFKLVVFDPPHLIKLGKTSWMAKKYGLLSENWRDDLQEGFRECWRVLDDNGVLIFKWNERDVSVSEVLGLFDVRPLFGHTTGRSGKTKWMCFMKFQEAGK